MAECDFIIHSWCSQRSLKLHASLFSIYFYGSKFFKEFSREKETLVITSNIKGTADKGIVEVACKSINHEYTIKSIQRMSERQGMLY